MKKTVSFLLAFAMALSILLSGTPSVYAQPDEETPGQQETNTTEQTTTSETESSELQNSEQTEPSESESTEPSESESTEPSESESTEPSESESTEPSESESTEPSESESTEPSESESTEPSESESTEPSESESTEPEETEPETTEPEFDGMMASADCIGILKLEEGFSRVPYWDYTQWTVGYGTRCPDDKLAQYSTYGITEAEAEALLRNHLKQVYIDLNKFIAKNELTITQNQFDAMVLMSYNCGTNWAFDKTGTLYNAIVNGATGSELIRAFARWCKAGGEVKSYLLRRRLSESNIYLNGIYSQTPPDNYCYVIYNGNGGSVSPSSQGYDSNQTALPQATATRPGYTFVGWFTEPIGGTQVTVLDASVKNAYIYAQWVDSNGNPPPQEPENKPMSVTVTVTTNSVNLRKGAGTNYTIIGSANTGDQFVITAVAEGSGYLWGQYDGGWICLKYTNYDSVKDQTPPKPTQPTEPETTEPETTEPETTEPETTEPAPTEPPKVTGTVKANGGLSVRKGPGTGYDRLRYLENGAKVEILEQRAVGAMIWGRIEDGWISMSYVVLDVIEPEEEEPTQPTEPETTEPETTEPETTEPETTEPETTEPETTEPETTEPETTEPETTEPAPTEPAPTEPPKVTGTVKANGGLSVRKGPGTGYDRLHYLQNGAKVEILEQRTVGTMVWGRIEDGWISMSYVVLDVAEPEEEEPTQPTEPETTEPKPTEPKPTEPEQIKATVSAVSGLSVRTGPGVSYSLVKYLYKGQKVTITETKLVGDVKWGKIADGWICMLYVDLNNTQDTPTQQPQQPQQPAQPQLPQYGTVKVNGSLSVRSGPGASYSVRGYLNNGNKVTITQIKTVGGIVWGKMSTGWVCMDYIVLSGTSSGTTGGTTFEPITKTVTASSLCVRAYAGTNYQIIGHLTAGTKVKIVEIKTVGGTQWGRTSQGWICLDYVK